MRKFYRKIREYICPVVNENTTHHQHNRGLFTEQISHTTQRKIEGYVNGKNSW